MTKKINIELYILIVGRVVQILIALVTIKLATKFLQASEMGNFYLILSIVSFFGFFLISPIGQYINRKTHEWYESENIMHVFYIYNLYIIFISVFSVAIVFLLNYFDVGSSIELNYLVYAVFLFIYFNTWNQTIIPMINMLEKRVVFVVFTLLSQFLFLFLAYIFISIFGEKGVFWFLGQTIAYGVLALIALIYFRKKLQSNFNINIANKMISLKNLKKILNYSLPLSIGVLFFWLQAHSYNIIIVKNIGSEFLGYFGVGMAVALAISNAFETVVMQYLYPKMYKSMNDDAKFSQMISNIINLILPIYFLLALFISFFAIYINSILVDIKYFDSYIYVIFGIWIAFFRMSSNIISNIAHSKMKTKSLIMPNFIGALIAVIGVVIATNNEDYQLYVPLVLLTASLISFIYMYINMNNLVPFKIEIKKLLNVLVMAIPFLVSFIFYSFSSSIIYSILIIGFFGLYFIYIILYLIKKENAVA